MAALDLMLFAATLLFTNGQTTERTIDATVQLAARSAFIPTCCRAGAS